MLKRLPLFCLLCVVSLTVMVRVLYVLQRDYISYPAPQTADQVILTTGPRPTVEPEFYFELNNLTNIREKKDKLMFLKTHKCGTSSLVTILYLFGIRRNLNFLLTPYEHQFFNDQSPQELAPGQEYDILCQHHRSTGAWDYYRPWIIHPYLPKEKTFYFTILRDPAQQFLSNYFFYDHQMKLKKKYKIQGKTVDAVLKQYLAKLPKSSLTCNNLINPMSYDLGFSHFLQKKKGLSPDVQILNFIKYLDKEFDLIMITNEFDKSLVLLKHYLDWKIDDVVYLKKMTRSLRETPQTVQSVLSDETAEQLRFHNRVDIKVFQYFQQRFRAQLATLDKRQVEAELETLQAGQSDLVSQCLNMSNVIKTKLGTVFHPLSETGKTSNACRLWTLSDVYISKSLAAKQDPNFSAEKLENKHVKYGTVVNFLKLFEGIRAEYMRSSGTL